MIYRVLITSLVALVLLYITMFFVCRRIYRYNKLEYRYEFNVFYYECLNYSKILKWPLSTLNKEDTYSDDVYIVRGRSFYRNLIWTVVTIIIIVIIMN